MTPRNAANPRSQKVWHRVSYEPRTNALQCPSHTGLRPPVRSTTRSLIAVARDPLVSNPDTQCPSLPGWVPTADAATVVLGALTAHVAVFGALVLGPISIGDPWRVLVATLTVGGLRHYHLRTPSIYHRLCRTLRAGYHTDAFQAAWPIALATRIAVLLVGYLAVVSLGFPEGAPPIRVSNNEALNLGLRWDTGWYLNIAMEGYRWNEDEKGQQNIAFFPGYPLVTAAVANLLGSQSVFRQPQTRPPRQAIERLQQRFLSSAILVSLFAFLWSMVWLYRLAREHLDEPAARGTLLLLATYPFAVFFSAAYSESLMLLSIVAGFYHFRHEKWIAAAGWGLLAGLTRPNGFLLTGPLGIICVRQLLARRSTGASREARARHALLAGAVAAMPIVGALIFSGFIYRLTGDPLAWREAHTAWGRDYTGFPPLFVWLGAFGENGIMHYTSSQPIEALNALFAVLTCTLIWPVTRKLGPEYGLLMVLNVVPPLLFGGFLSMGRVTSLLFPMFMYLALVLADRQRQAVVCGFACIQGLAAVLFFTWHRFL